MFVAKSYEPGNDSLGLYYIAGDWRIDWVFQRQEPGFADYVGVVCCHARALRRGNHIQGVCSGYFAGGIDRGFRDSSCENEEVYACGHDARDYFAGAGFSQVC